MAVPKKKRYRQVVKSRRSLFKIDSIKKLNLSINKFNNYANISTEFENVTYCSLCNSNDISNKLCASCYVLYYVNFFEKKREIKNKKNRNRDLEREYYYELSKTFFPSSGS